MTTSGRCFRTATIASSNGVAVFDSAASVPSVSRICPMTRASTPTTSTLAVIVVEEVGVPGERIVLYRCRPTAPVGFAERVPGRSIVPSMNSSKSLGL